MEAVNYFSKLFTRDALPTEAEEQAILDYIPLLVSTKMNEALLSPIKLLELDKVVFNLKKERPLV